MTPLEPRYLQRDDNGKVIGHYANPQPYAQEQVPGDHPEILKWNERRKADRKRASPAMQRIEQLEAKIEALSKKLKESGFV